MNKATCNIRVQEVQDPNQISLYTLANNNKSDYTEGQGGYTSMGSRIYFW